MNRKKTLFLLAASCLIVGCGQKEKNELAETLQHQFESDSDIKDYHLDPKMMADCVVDGIEEDIPGAPWDPKKGEYFQAYTKLISVRENPAQAETVLAEVRNTFGSPKGATKAGLSISENTMNCISAVVYKTEEETG